MKQTKNYSLKKPDLTDMVDINDFNSNADKIDKELKKVNDLLNNNVSDLISQLDEKLNKCGIVTMANMGQDVKEAMTGTSVAVVGRNAVLDENIVTQQVTPRALSKSKNTLGDQLFIDKVVGEFVNAGGEIIKKEGYTSGRSDYIPVIGGNTYEIYGYTDIPSLLASWYNESKKFISNISIASTSSVNEKVYRIIAPASAKYLILNYKDTELEQTYVKEVMSNYELPWLKVTKDNLKNVKLNEIGTDTTFIEQELNLKVGYYVNINNGEETSYNNGTNAVSDFIEVNEGDLVKYSTYTELEKYNGVIYNSEKIKIGNLDSPTVAGQEMYMIMPTDAKYVRVNFSDIFRPWFFAVSTPTVLENLLLIAENIPSKLIDASKIKDKTINLQLLSDEVLHLINNNSGNINIFRNLKTTWIGDSITFGVGTTSTDKRYSELVVKELGMSKNGYQNLGLSASVISEVEDESWVVKSVVRRICDEGQIKSGQDIIFWLGGVNDLALNVPISTMQEQLNYFKTNGKWNDKTFYGALNRAFSYIRNNHPDSQFIFISTIHYDMEDIRHNGNRLLYYIQAIREVCEYYAVPLIDLYKNLPLDPKNIHHRNKYTMNGSLTGPDGCHPSDLGNRLIADYIINWLKNNFVK